MEKDGDYLFCFGGFLYLYLMYRSPCQQFLEMKEKKDKNGMQGRMKPPLYGVYAVTRIWVYHVSVRGYPAVTAFCCLFRVVLGLCVDVIPSLRFFFVISPLVWCLLIITDGHASSDWSPGPMLVGVRLGACMRREWVVSGLCF